MTEFQSPERQTFMKVELKKISEEMQGFQSPERQTFMKVVNASHNAEVEGFNRLNGKLS